MGGGTNDYNPIRIKETNGAIDTTYRESSDPIAHDYQDSCFSAPLNKVYFGCDPPLLGDATPDYVLAFGFDVTTGDFVYYSYDDAGAAMLGSYICTDHTSVFLAGRNGIFDTYSVIKLNGQTLAFESGSAVLPYAIKGMWLGYDGNIWVSQLTAGGGNTDGITSLDPSTLAVVDTWTTVGDFAGTTALGNSRRPAIAVLGISDIDLSSVSQTRTVAYPEDRKHLEGQEVQVLSDGIHLDDTTYTIASGVVSPSVAGTNQHIALQVVSKLQPMKIDGEVDVKRIRYLIPDVFESVGGEYGKELDDMYDVQLRASGDPMDKDEALYSGYVELPFKGELDRQGDIWIKQDIPLGMNILGIGVKLSKESI